MTKQLILIVALPLVLALAAALYFTNKIDAQKARVEMMQSGLDRVHSETTELAALESTAERVLIRMRTIENLHRHLARQNHLVLAGLADGSAGSVSVNALSLVDDQLRLELNGGDPTAAETWLASLRAAFPAVTIGIEQTGAAQQGTAGAQ